MDEPSTRTDLKPLAVVTGASSGIGYELAKLFCENGYDLAIAADTSLAEAEQAFRSQGAEVISLETDLATEEGVQQFYALIRSAARPVDAFCANAGEGLGHAFLDQPFDRIKHMINTNITGTMQLMQLIGRDMRERDRGRILITGSIAGLMPGSFQAVYNGTKAFLDSFSFALRNELKDTGVTVTCLMPGATETQFFHRAEMDDTKVGAGKKADPADVAKTGFDALMRGEGDVVHGMDNKLRAAMAAVTPQTQLAEIHRGMAEPGSGEK
jgi:short-subunit dehydrogenase